MNFLFLSPHFPPHYVHFVRALREAGIRVLGVGDTHYDVLPGELKDTLSEYFHVPNMNDLSAMIRAAGYFTWKYGKLDRIDSLNEHWLQVDAELRREFNVVGMSAEQTVELRSKWGLFELFDRAKIPTIPTAQATTTDAVKAFGKKHGYPLVLKPAVGVGAVGAFKVSSDAEVEAKFSPALRDHVVQAFIRGQIVTWDGVVDKDGKIVFALSHEYSDGVMETVSEQRDISFWSERKIPPALDKLGRQVVKELNLRERWFHLEFFRTAPDAYIVLEANLRPPGGFMTDMMNYTSDMDVYRIYAAVVAGRDVESLVRPPRYHVCHVGRKVRTRSYKRTRAEVANRLGNKLIWARDLPPLFAAAMGDEMFLTRHQTSEEMHSDIRWIQELS